MSIYKNGSLYATKGGGGAGGINYSTEEQDTGLTWIDGKKIYQKTFAYEGNQTTNEHVIDNFYIDTLVDVKGVWTRYVSATDFMQYSIPGFETTQIFAFARKNIDNRIMWRTYIQAGTPKDVYLTIIYTKTEE